MRAGEPGPGGDSAGATSIASPAYAHLEHLWRRAHWPQGAPPPLTLDQWRLSQIVLYGFGLGLEQALTRLRGFETFEAVLDWVAEVTGGPDPASLARLDALLTGQPPPAAFQATMRAVAAAEPVLDADDLAGWETHGYTVLRQAISPDEAAAAADAVWRHLRADPDDPSTWYPRRTHGIMVQYFQHPAFEASRRSMRVHKAFAQLWGRADLWASVDRVSFSPPERPGYRFPGPPLHWDAALVAPIAFATQGILYLTDTPAEQGALRVVPGFHHRIDDWLRGLPPGVDPARHDFSAETKPIGAGAGDLVIWSQALPHGPSPNTGTRPRIAQYVNLVPAPAQA